jgi:hypothetical protein
MRLENDKYDKDYPRTRGDTRRMSVDSTILDSLNRAYDKRKGERARYLAINGSIYDNVAARWQQYENLIIRKYRDREHRFRYPRWAYYRELDVAWIERDSGREK